MTVSPGAGSPLGTPADATPAYCGHCGRGLDAADHAVCARALTMEPPRFCGVCKRRMKVQVTPTGWRAECSRHGELTAPGADTSSNPSANSAR